MCIECAFHDFFKKSGLSKWDSCSTHVEIRNSNPWRMVTRRATVTQFLLHAGCFCSMLPQVRVFPKDPSGGPCCVVTLYFDPIYYITLIQSLFRCFGIHMKLRNLRQTNTTKVVATLLRGLGVLLLERNICVVVLPERMIVLVVVWKDTGWGTSLTSFQEGKMSIKLP